jgi:hypothetical protein
VSKVKNIDLSSFKTSPDSSVVVLDNHLLAFLKQLVAMGLAESWEVRINGPIDHDYTSTKLMQKLAKRIAVLTNHESIGG